MFAFAVDFAQKPTGLLAKKWGRTRAGQQQNAGGPNRLFGKSLNNGGFN
jgi:hypothetical protein